MLRINKIYGALKQLSTMQSGRSRINVDNYTRPMATTKLPLNTIINFVPQQEAWIVERFGKFNSTLYAGINIVIPFIDKIKYVHSLKEVAFQVGSQSAITRDNVVLHLDGVLFYRVLDPYKASYGIENHEYAITQLAQTTMRSEIGKMTLDDVFKERERLNISIIESIREASVNWGLECMRYEIKDVQPPVKILEAMQLQVEAERKKRAYILESEGQRDAAINQATGEAEAVMRKAEARSKAIKIVSDSLANEGGTHAASLVVAEQYISAFSNLAKESNTLILPSNVNDVTSSVAHAMTIFNKLSSNQKSSINDHLPYGLKNMNSLAKNGSFQDDFLIENSPTFNKSG